MISKKEVPIKQGCKILGVSKSTYYYQKKILKEKKEEKEVLKQIEKVIQKYPMYGYRRVTKELYRNGERINHKRILRIMRQNGLLHHSKKKYKIQTTDSNHEFRTYPNLAKNLEVTGLNQLWVSDITFVHLPYGFVYLAVIIDVYSRKCIGWALSTNMTTELVSEALDKALTKRAHLGFDKLVHHSDQGVQYASNDYTDMLKQLGIQISMSRKGNPYDNAFAESFMKTIKNEEVYLKEYKNYKEAKQNIKHFIELVYNDARLHSSIGYMPPNEFETQILNS